MLLSILQPGRHVTPYWTGKVGIELLPRARPASPSTRFTALCAAVAVPLQSNVICTTISRSPSPSLSAAAHLWYRLEGVQF